MGMICVYDKNKECTGILDCGKVCFDDTSIEYIKKNTNICNTYSCYEDCEGCVREVGG